MDTKDITAAQYLHAEEQAARDTAGKAALRSIKRHLDEHPEIKWRLANELMDLASRHIKQGGDAWGPALLAIGFGTSVQEDERQEFLNRLECFVAEAFALLGPEQRRVSRDLRELVAALGLSLSAIQGIDERRFHRIVASLGCQCQKDSRDPRAEILKELAETPKETHQRVTRLIARLKQRRQPDSREAWWASN